MNSNNPDGWHPSPAQGEFLEAHEYLKKNNPAGFKPTPRQQAYIRSLRGFESRLPAGENLHPSYQIPTKEPPSGRPAGTGAHPRASGFNVGGNAAAVGMGALGAYQAYQQGDAGGVILGSGTTAVGMVGTAAEVAALRGSTGTLATTGRSIAGRAALPLAVAAAGYDVYKEEGTGADDKTQFKVARGAAGAAGIGVGIATGAAAAGATVATVGVAGVAAAVAAPIAAVVAVGWAANAMVDVGKQYAVEDKRFAARQDNRHVESAKYRILNKTAAENEAMRRGFAARGAKFNEDGQFDLNDAGTRQVVREELEKKKTELRRTIKGSDGWIISPRYNPFASNRRVDAFNNAKSDLAIMESATTELDNYGQNRDAMLATRAAAERERTAVAAEAAKVKAVIDRLPKNSDGSITLEGYAHKDGEKRGMFDRESLGKLNGDVTALRGLTENGKHPELVRLRDELARMAQEANQVLTRQEEEIRRRQAGTGQPSVNPIPATPTTPLPANGASGTNNLAPTTGAADNSPTPATSPKETGLFDMLSDNKGMGTLGIIGAIIGWLIGGPIGALIGMFLGGGAGAMADGKNGLLNLGGDSNQPPASAMAPKLLKEVTAYAQVRFTNFQTGAVEQQKVNQFVSRYGSMAAKNMTPGQQDRRADEIMAKTAAIKDKIREAAGKDADDMNRAMREALAVMRTTDTTLIQLADGNALPPVGSPVISAEGVKTAVQNFR